MSNYEQLPNPENDAEVILGGLINEYKAKVLEYSKVFCNDSFDSEIADSTWTPKMEEARRQCANAQDTLNKLYRLRNSLSNVVVG